MRHRVAAVVVVVGAGVLDAVEEKGEATEAHAVGLVTGRPVLMEIGGPDRMALHPVARAATDLPPEAALRRRPMVDAARVVRPTVIDLLGRAIPTAPDLHEASRR